MADGEDLFKRLTWVQVIFYADGQWLGEITSQVMPNFQEGQYVELQFPMTARDRERSPLKEANSSGYVIDMIHPIIKRSESGLIEMKYEILLIKPPDIPDADKRPFPDILREFNALRKNRRKRRDSRQ